DEAEWRVVADAHRRLLADTLARFVNKEVKAIRQATKRPDEFLAWIDEYYSHHKDLVAEALAPVIDAWQSVPGVCSIATPEMMADMLARQHCERSRDALLDLAGEVTAAELPVKAEEIVGMWEANRAQAMAAEVIP